jgi:dihydrofolate reductase
VIGGESIFNLLLPYCTEAYVTKIFKTYPADKYFINIDRAENWQLAYEGQLQTYGDIPFKFTRYIK